MVEHECRLRDPLSERCGRGKLVRTHDEVTGEPMRRDYTDTAGDIITGEPAGIRIDVREVPNAAERSGGWVLAYVVQLRFDVSREIDPADDSMPARRRYDGVKEKARLGKRVVRLHEHRAANHMRREYLIQIVNREVTVDCSHTLANDPLLGCYRKVPQVAVRIDHADS